MGDAVSLAEETESGSSPASRLLELIDQKVGSEAARAFAQAYLRRLSGDASEGIAAEQLLAEVVGAFEFASARGDEPMAVRAFNPTLAEHGYEPLGSVVETNTDDSVTWLHSYVSTNRRTSFCIYDGPSPEAIRRTATRNRLPVDSITEVRVLDPYFYR